MKKIEITDKLIVLFFVGMLLVSCGVQNNLPASPSAETTTTFPKQNIPLPCENFEWLLPAPPAVETAHAPRKPITEQLSDRERNHIGVKDAKRFAESNTEIIDLSLIPEEEYAFQDEAQRYNRGCIRRPCADGQALRRLWQLDRDPPLQWLGNSLQS